MSSHPSVRCAVLLVALTLALVVLPVARAEAPTEGAAEGGDFLPTPYTAEQIREATPTGHWVRYRTESPAGTTVRQNRVLESTADSVRMADQAVDERGEATGEAREFSSTWEGLRRHALFPVSRAKRQRETRTTALGELAGWLYAVEAEDGGSVASFFFADDFPGAPVLYWSTAGGETTLRVEHVARSDADPAEQRSARD